VATKKKMKWSELTPTQRVLVVCGGLIQLTLFALAQRDLSHRSADTVNGPKWVWRLATMINFIGPIAYFRCGRKPQQAAS
jgi:hypothetical protein